MTSSQQPSRETWLDTLRLVAGVSMLGLHATADPGGQPFVDFTPEERVVPMLMRAIIYTARTELFIIIALFLLIAGLDRRPRSYAEVVSEQARRLLVPFCFWTLFYAPYGLIKANAMGYGAELQAELADPFAWLSYFLLGSVKYHMHFLPTLFAIILFFPLFRAAERTPVVAILVLAGLAVKHEVDGFLYAHLWDSPWLEAAVRTAKVFTYVGYGLVAAAFAGIWRRTQVSERSLWVGPLLYVGGGLFLIKLIATYQTVTTGTWPFDYVAGFWADFLMPVVLFAICFALSGRNWPPALSRIAPYSFGIYLCHPIFLDLIEVWIAGMHLSPTVQVVSKIAIALPCTAALTFLLSRSSLLAWTVGLGPLPVTRKALMSGFVPQSSSSQTKVS